jgi:hypothetical protein
MRSFDVFDTLIARRCIGPLALYGLVAQRAFGERGSELAERRSHAGHALWQRGSHSTRDIWALALQGLAQSAGQADALAQLEFEVELQEVIAVRKHLATLQHADVLISDMHHPAWQIEALVRKAHSSIGRNFVPPLLLTNRGKHDGTLWAELARTVGPLQHLGDNAHSDMAQARAHGHQPQHTNWTAPNAAEQALMAAGANALARAARSARLQQVGSAHGTHAPDGALQSLIEAQCSLVFALLGVGALWLRQRMGEQGAQAVLFLGRDGATWLRVFSALFPAVPASAIASSRDTLTLHGAVQARSVAQALQSLAPPGQCLVADLCGSGATWGHFLHQHGPSVGLQPTHPQLALNLMLRYPNIEHTGGWPTSPVHTLAHASQFSAAATFTLETLCEETHAVTSALAWHGGRTGWAQALTKSPQAEASTSPLAEPLQLALNVAIAELRTELQRSHDSVSVGQLPALAGQLMAQLGPLAATTDSLSAFRHRNAQAAYRMLGQMPMPQVPSQTPT